MRFPGISKADVALHVILNVLRLTIPILWSKVRRFPSREDEGSKVFRRFPSRGNGGSKQVHRRFQPREDKGSNVFPSFLPRSPYKSRGAEAVGSLIHVPFAMSKVVKTPTTIFLAVQRWFKGYSNSTFIGDIGYRRRCEYRSKEMKPQWYLSLDSRFI